MQEGNCKHSVKKKIRKNGRTHCAAASQSVDKESCGDFYCKSLAEFRRPQTTEENQGVFFGGVYVEKHSLRPQVCERQRAAQGCISSKNAAF